MKLAVLILIFSFISISGTAKGKPSEKLPFIAKEPVVLNSARETPLLGLTRTADFVGTVTRENIQDPISRDFDLYEFKNVKVAQLDTKTCSMLASKIFGPLDKISLVVQSNEVKSSPSKDKACALVLQDKDPNGEIKERHALIHILKSRTFGYVFRFSKSASPAEIKDISQFVESLR